MFGGEREPVYARSATDASFDRERIEIDSAGFQCTELAVRYLYFERGITVDWDIHDAWQMCTTHPTDVVVVTTPAVGDLIVFPANEPTYDIGSAGHVAIISGLTAYGSVQTFQQRWGDETTAFADGIDPDHASCFLHADPP